MMQFKCPHCQKVYKAKAEFAGRKATCHACHKAFVVAPTAAAAVGSAALPATGVAEPAIEEIDAVAAAALAPDKAPEETKLDTGTIDFRCYYCDEEIHLSPDLAGKQAPCPQCRRIIKVPQFPRQDSKDWRNTKPNLPAGARRDDDAPLSGSWGTETTVSRVSQLALKEANAIPQAREPISVRKWIDRGLLLAIVGGVAFGLYSWISWKLSERKRDRTMQIALAYEYRPESERVLTPLTAAFIRRAAGEFYGRAGQTTNAREQLASGRNFLPQTVVSPDHDALLIEIGVTQVGLLLEPEVVEQNINADEVRADQKLCEDELRTTMCRSCSPAGRAEAFRQVTRALLKRKRGDLAPLLAQALDEATRAEMQAVVGLELLEGSSSSSASTLFDQILSMRGAIVTDDAGGQRLTSPALIALCVALKNPRIDNFRPKDPRADLYWLQGNAEGLAMLDRVDEAKEQVQGIQGLDRLRILANVAAIALGKDKAQTAVAEEVIKQVEDLQGKYPDNDRCAPSGFFWSLVRLVRACLAAGNQKLAERLTAAIPDQPAVAKGAGGFQDDVLPAFRALAQLEVYRASLAASNQQEPQESAEKVDKTTVSHARACELWARHNAALSSRKTMKAVESWQQVNLQPFGYAGISLGIQDNAR